MSVFDIAGARRASSNYTTYSPLDAYPQIVDSDGSQTWTRALCTRDSDMALCAIYAKGAHADTDIVDALNTLSRLRFERRAAQDARDALDEDASEDAITMADATIAEADSALKDALAVKAEVTYHVARTLTAFANTDAEQPETIEQPETPSLAVAA